MPKAWIGLADPNARFFARHDKKRGVIDSSSGPAASDYGEIIFVPEGQGNCSLEGSRFGTEQKTPDICLDARMTGDLLKQAAPGRFQGVLGLLARRPDEQSQNGTMDKTLRAAISGSRLFNTVFGLLRDRDNITRSLGTCQSGSPPVLATSILPPGRKHPGP